MEWNLGWKRRNGATVAECLGEGKDLSQTAGEALSLWSSSVGLGNEEVTFGAVNPFLHRTVKKHPHGI